jgi:oxygen-independent coproporphyrinogen III oxidase
MRLNIFNPYNMLTALIRDRISRHFTRQKEIVLSNKIPSNNILAKKFLEIDEAGIYLHIPFCNSICHYCPYNKEIFTEEACREYVNAVIKEIDTYIPLLKNIRITSFYIGGGTPTTMLHKGIEVILNHLYKHLNMNCTIHMESHPNHLTAKNLDIIESIGVKYLSAGLEALQDRHLRALGRPYTAKEAIKNIRRATYRSFDCVNVDLIFDLPGQTEYEVVNAGKEIVKMGVKQVATYPLFNFQYTRLAQKANKNGNQIETMFRRRRLMKIFEGIFYRSDFYRSSVWAFTKNHTDKYCSVTVPLYLGLGTSGSSYLKDIFYINTFKVSEYIRAFKEKRSPIALTIDLSEEMQMAGWLYWRIYETRFRKSDFNQRFGRSFDDKYGSLINIFSGLGYLKNGDDQITLTDKGAYWIHAFEDLFSISYINKLWGTSIQNPWPEKVIL